MAASSLSLSASALAPSVRSARVSLKEYYEGLSKRFEVVKFLGVFEGQGAAPAALAGPPQDVPQRGALAGVPFVVSPDIDVGGGVTHALRASLFTSESSAKMKPRCSSTCRGG